MKWLKIFAIGIFLILVMHTKAQNNETGTVREAVKDYINKEPKYKISSDIEIEAIKKVLKAYSNAVENLDVSGTENLFTSHSSIFESGGSEGNYSNYLNHHLVPELKEFRSFKYNDYKAEVEVQGNYAFTSETYTYIIVLQNNTEVTRKGVATSVLQKIKGKWKIKISHNSSRK